MRLLTILFFVGVITACQATGPPTPTTEAEMIAEAEQLIRFSLTERFVRDTETRYRDQINNMYADKNGFSEDVSRIVNEEVERLSAIEHKRLIDNLVPIYLRFFTADEIHQLLSFYKTDVASKSINVSKQIAAESRQYVRLWNDHYGDVLLQKIDVRLTEAGHNRNR